MKDNLKASIDKGESIFVDSYIYKDYLVYRYHRLDHFTLCKFCDLLHSNNCSIIRSGDKNNPLNCGTYEIIDGKIILRSLRYSYEKMNMNNISLFLSRFLIKRYEHRTKESY